MVRVTTVIPVEMVEDDLKLHRIGDFKVANGEKIQRYGKIRMPVMDERGNRRGISATVTHVHKPLGRLESSARIMTPTFGRMVAFFFLAMELWPLRCATITRGSQGSSATSR